MPLVMSIFATGKNKYYQIIVSLFISLNLVLTWVFLKFGFSPEFIFYTRIIVSMLVLLVRLYFANKQAEVSILEFFTKSIVPIVKVVLLTVPFYYLISKFWTTSGWLTLLLTIAFVAVILISVCFVGLTTGERAFLIGTIKNKIFKKQ